MNESSKVYQSDLQDLSTDEMEAMIAEKKSTLRLLDSRRGSTDGKERASAYCKGAQNCSSWNREIGVWEKDAAGRVSFHEKTGKDSQRKRDEINVRIPPPSKILEEWLGETYLTLTKIDNDLTTVPMLNPELSAFSRFFEIQSSIKRREKQKNLILNIFPS